MLKIHSFVQQVSVLGPVLFIIDMNDLSRDFTAVHFHSCADDTLTYCLASTLKPPITYKELFCHSELCLTCLSVLIRPNTVLQGQEQAQVLPPRSPFTDIVQSFNHSGILTEVVSSVKVAFWELCVLKPQCVVAFWQMVLI